ncbi:MAG: HPr family phosphocarrier protein [Huintestinicola sp.]|uniref:HPr family phosphocarrier protein n=1 Tax=Huintestinicola sp. TaxID=2981661 RepID=UPI002A8EC51E|nr:HPr family phosphocarrier protein [Oscillospiraceae bacterium]MDY3791335.1 HPr family phosphocarrier protein [Oscillospiraceae bacterium]
MKKTTIMLATINDVKNFVSEVSLCDYDVDLLSGRYAVDAKSIMGIFSLDLSKPISLEAHTDDASEFFENIKQFIVE